MGRNPGRTDTDFWLYYKPYKILSSNETEATSNNT